MVVVPSSRVVKSLKSYAGRIANKLDALTVSAQLDDDILLDEIWWFRPSWPLSPDTAKEDFDAAERILNLERE